MCAIQSGGISKIDWARRKGDVDAESNLGVEYRDDDGVKQDGLDAVKWFEKSR